MRIVCLCEKFLQNNLNFLSFNQQTIVLTWRTVYLYLLVKVDKMFYFVLILPSLLLLSNSFCYCNNAIKVTCSSVTPNGKRLVNHLYLNSDLTSYERCKKKCYFHRSCKSFNHQRVTFLCELNDADADTNAIDLKLIENWTYTVFSDNETVRFVKIFSNVFLKNKSSIFFGIPIHQYI